MLLRQQTLLKGAVFYASTNSSNIEGNINGKPYSLIYLTISLTSLVCLYFMCCTRNRGGGSYDATPLLDTSVNGNHDENSKAVEIGDELGLKIVSNIGEGTFAKVFLVREIGGLSNYFALKVFKSKTDYVLRRNEMAGNKLISKIGEHGNVARVFYVDNNPLLRYIKMEYSPGIEFYWLINYIKDIRHVNRRKREATLKLNKSIGKLTISGIEADNLLHQALKAINHLHVNEVCHGDIKSENFMLYKDDHENLVVKLVDFGFVKKNLQKYYYTGLSGTHYYSSAELYINEFLTRTRGDSESYHSLKEEDTWATGVFAAELFNITRYDRAPHPLQTSSAEFLNGPIKNLGGSKVTQANIKQAGYEFKKQRDCGQPYFPINTTGEDTIALHSFFGGNKTERQGAIPNAIQHYENMSK